MPVVVRTRSYDQQFYRETGISDYQDMDDQELFAEAELAKSDLGF